MQYEASWQMMDLQTEGYEGRGDVDGDYARFTLRPPSVEAKDTTAAGDSFVAGLLYRLGDQADDSRAFDHWLRQPDKLEEALVFASRCGAYTAMHYGAFEALPTLGPLQRLVPETI